MNYFEEMDKIDAEIKAVNEEFNNNTDKTKYQYYMDKLEELEKKRDKIGEDFANEAMKEKEQKEKEYREKNFDGEPLELIKFCIEKNICLRTDDFGYGEWQKEVPQRYLNEARAAGDEKLALKKYYDVMGDLEELFMHLAYFQEDISGYFPEQILRIKVEDTVIEMNYIVGQGSDFSIRPVKVKEEDFVFDWKDAFEVSKMKTFDQAMWYYENALVDAIAELPIEMIKDDINRKIFFLLGTAATGRFGFVQRLNPENIKKVLSELMLF